MVQGVKNVIVTNDARRYKKPGIVNSIAGFYAGSAAQAVVASATIPVSIFAIKNIRKMNEGINNAEISKAIKDAMEISGINQKGVKLNTFSPKSNLSIRGVYVEYSEFLKNLILRSMSSGKPIKGDITAHFLKFYIRHGYNGAFEPKNNRIYINIDKMGTSTFHEIGHAINRNASIFWRSMQKLRAPMTLAAIALPMIALLKCKKAEGEEPKGIIDKTTTFIKNNVGKLTALTFVPIVAEELMATSRGNALAKKVLSPELASKVIKTNRFSSMIYILTGMTSVAGAYLANAVRDSIAKPKEIKQ